MKSGVRLLIPALLLLSLFSGCRLFLPYYTLSLEVENGIGGILSCEPQRDDYPENTIVMLSAEADPGWELEYWSGVTDSEGARASVLMDLNRRVTVSFRPVLKHDNPSDNMISEPSSVGFAPAGDESWTFMVYLDADNSLDPYALADFNEIEKGFGLAGNPNLNIIVLMDRYQGGSYLYRIDDDLTSGIDSTPLTAIIDGKTVSEVSGAELNMGKPGVLSDFLKFCRLESSTDRYALMFWNHGGGTRSYIEPEYEVAGRHICEDADTGEGIYPDYLFMDEVQKALETAETEAPFTEGFDIISIDACIMATVEAAYELRNLASVYVSSMSNVAASGWNYEELFRRMTPGTGEASVEALSVLMVDTFKTVMSGLPDQSLSAVRCSELPILKTRIDALASALFEADRMKMIEYIRDAAVDFFNDDFNEEAVAQPYHDLNDLCWLLINNADYMSAAVVSAASGVLDALGSTVIAAYAGPVLGNYYGSGTDLERGLSIFFSKGNEEFGSLNHYASQYWYTDKDCSSIGPYGFIDFCTSDEDGIVESWREMHEAWYDPYKPEGYTPGSW